MDLGDVTSFVVYTGFILSILHWMLRTQTKQINAQIQPINDKLDNHITDTNKKIDKLSDRFDRLYEMLLKDK